MDVWGWIVLYVVLFSLLQLFIYRYLQRDDDSATLFRSTPPNGDPAAVEEIREFDDRPRNTDPSVVVCPRCGTENETGFTYCRNCVSPMTAR
ncbi:zinc ribbon domain-containing protein [Halorussus salilacus]|uniref:DUF7577 domain-containing protein n=1 Tax=Halorussus salilacus TaxID=2953750 RepID=UPI0020A0E31E|nr:zinc ribbon domain-containing protein [Halorussus salilacus]USZ67201.1 zinc ribbon domain-containing protein [Halorussus salilacus]